MDLQEVLDKLEEAKEEKNWDLVQEALEQLIEMKKTIFALSTPESVSAIAVIRISGPDTLNALGLLCRCNVKSFKKKEFYHYLKTSNLSLALSIRLVCTYSSPRYSCAPKCSGFASKAILYASKALSRFGSLCFL